MEEAEVEAEVQGEDEVLEAAQRFGLDERAQELLMKLTPDKQQIVLEKLTDGVTSGKVRNASSYTVGICNGPDLLGLDERATQMLNELPLDSRKAVIEKLRKSTDVRNPSAWVARAVHQAKSSLPMAVAMVPVSYPAMRQHAVPTANVRGSRALSALDPGARALLQTLPPAAQGDILGKLQQQQGVNNPSAWVVKAAVEAGAQPQGGQTQGGAAAVGRGFPQGGARGWRPPAPPPPAPPMAVRNRMAARSGLDDGARELLHSLPLSTQRELLGKLESQPHINNPSGWMVKAALAAGAQKGGAAINSFDDTNQEQGADLGDLQLDERALALLSTISADAQQEILNKLRNSLESGQVRNPSAWVVKAALKEGATSSLAGEAPQQQIYQQGAFGKMAHGKVGPARSSPYMR